MPATSVRRRLTPLVERTRGPQPWRRVFHAGNGLILAWFLSAAPSRSVAVGGLAALALVLVAGDLVRLRIPRLNVLFFEAFPSLASPREEARVASSTWYAVGVLLAAALFPVPLVIPAVLVLALADPAASALGRAVGRRPVGKGTLAGSLTFFVVAAGVLAALVGWAPALVVALGTAMVEALPWGLDDNLTVPPAAAALLWMVAV